MGQLPYTEGSIDQQVWLILMTACNLGTAGGQVWLTLQTACSLGVEPGGWRVRASL